MAYYLIHSLGTGASFEQRDRDAAANLRRGRHVCRAGRSVYLGGIVS